MEFHFKKMTLHPTFRQKFKLESAKINQHTYLIIISSLRLLIVPRGIYVSAPSLNLGPRCKLWPGQMAWNSLPEFPWEFDLDLRGSIFNDYKVDRKWPILSQAGRLRHRDYSQRTQRGQLQLWANFWLIWRHKISAKSQPYTALHSAQATLLSRQTTNFSSIILFLLSAPYSW